MEWEGYTRRARHMVEDEYDRAARRWGFEHDLEHTEEEWEALILERALAHDWKAAANLATRALAMRIARPIEALS